jgi:lambda family phage portal protein
MNFLDRAVSFFNPQAGVQRAFAREKLKAFGYDAAHPGTARGGSGGRNKNASSETWRSQRDRVLLMWDARDVVRNFALLRGIVARIVQYVADTVQYVSQTGDEEIDSLYQDYFHAWCERADITGRHRLGDLVWMLVWAIIVDGDHGWHIVSVDENGKQVPKIQPIEADRIGDPNSPINPGEDNNIGGIFVDEMGRPLSYKIFKRERRTAQYSFDREVPADQFIHIFDPQRVDQYRGVSALATAIAPARDLYEIYQFEKTAAKWQAGYAGFVKTPDPTRGDGGVSAWNGTTTGKPGASPMGLMEVAPGKIQRLAAGEDIQFAPGTSRPGGAFMALVQVMVREISSGLNMPYGFLYDMTAFSGHTGRIEIAQAMRGIRRMQKLVGERALNPVRDAVIGYGIGMGELPPHPQWRNGRWGFGRSLTGDYGHDTTANLQMLQNGLVTASDLISETGQSFEEVVRRSASEVAYMQRVATETGVPIELFNQRIPNPTQALAAMAEPPQPPPPGLVPQGMDVKPLLELLKNVGEGIIDRESAIINLMNLYGVERMAAEKMVPDGPGEKKGLTAEDAENAERGK